MPPITKRDEQKTVVQHISREGVFRMTNWSELTSANRAFFKLFGYESVEEFNGERTNTIFVNFTDEMLVKAKLVAGESIVDRRVLLKAKGPRNFWGLFSCIPDGTPQSYMGTVIDISALVQHEQSLRRNASALAKANMELDRFIYSASHDIRSPISTVMGLVNLINIEPDRDRQMELIGMIGTTMNKLDLFLHQLSTHSQNARRDIDVSRVDMNVLIGKILRELSVIPELAAIEVNTRIHVGEFYSDSERIGTVLFHVLKNAVDFVDSSKPGKEIDIQANIVRSKLVIEIFDNGIGIAEERVPNVFDMFYKASTKSRGSGLGLYLVRETVTRLNGIVSLYSKLGVGTLVRLEIPNSIYQVHDKV